MKREASPGPRGRGTAENPRSRFDRLEVELEEPVEGKVPTEFLTDESRSIIARNESPDVGFDASINPYRGCEHGCSYCYARPTHEYLGLSAGLDFETRILVKENAPELLADELAAPRWQPQVLGLSGVTDPYQPIERKLEITRRCLEVLVAFRNPAVVVTKNHLVTRDSDLLAELARPTGIDAGDDVAAAVFVSITTLDGEVARRLEPRTSRPARRLETIAELAGAGVPVGVLVAPVIPALNDHEIPEILAAARGAGADYAAWVMLRLPGAVSNLFEAWLERWMPDRRERILSRIRQIRGGRLNDSAFGTRGRGQGVFAEQIQSLFLTSARRLGFPTARPSLTTGWFRSADGQMALFSSHNRTIE
ncbi:MAG: PA0069 family radical SAM protein [Thermoanaerobaculia bacterium]